MNNGDKLRAMTNSEMAGIFNSKDYDMCPAKVECPYSLTGAITDEACYQCWLDYLNTEAETTGHEDLVNAGWYYCDNDCGNIYRLPRTGRSVIIDENETWYDTDGDCWTDEDVDFIRKCADKIRRANGWVK